MQNQQGAPQADWSEAKEQMGQMLRWKQEPRNPEDLSVYLGPTIQGKYVKKKTNIGTNESSIYEIILTDGNLIGMWGSNLIDGKFDSIPLNSEVYIEFLGITQPKTAKGRPYNDFKIQYRAPAFQDANAGAVVTPPVAPATPSESIASRPYPQTIPVSEPTPPTPPSNTPPIAPEPIPPTADTPAPAGGGPLTAAMGMEKTDNVPATEGPDGDIKVEKIPF